MSVIRFLSVMLSHLQRSSPSHDFPQSPENFEVLERRSSSTVSRLSLNQRKNSKVFDMPKALPGKTWSDHSLLSVDILFNLEKNVKLTHSYSISAINKITYLGLSKAQWWLFLGRCVLVNMECKFIGEERKLWNLKKSSLMTNFKWLLRL